MAPPRKATSRALPTPAARGLGHAGVGAHRDVHPDVAGGAGEQGADEEPEGDREVLDEDERHEDDHPDPGDHGVLAVEVRAGALLHGARDALHDLVARRQRQELARGHEAVGHGAQRAHQRDEHPVVGQERAQGFVRPPSRWSARGHRGRGPGTGASGRTGAEAPGAACEARGILARTAAEAPGGRRRGRPPTYWPGTQRRPERTASPGAPGPGGSPGPGPVPPCPPSSPSPCGPPGSPPGSAGPRPPAIRA